MEIWVVSTLSNAVVNNGVELSVLYLAVNHSGYIPKSGITGSYGNSMFNYLRNCQSVFYNNCIIILSHQKCMRTTISPHPC